MVDLRSCPALFPLLFVCVFIGCYNFQAALHHPIYPLLPKDCDGKRTQETCTASCTGTGYEYATGASAQAESGIGSGIDDVTMSCEELKGNCEF